MWWLRWTLEWCAITTAFIVACLWPNVLVWWLCALLIGTRQHALAIMGHWAVHNLVPNSKIFKWLCFAPSGVAPSLYQKHHFTHHKNISGSEDVEATIANKFKERWSKPRKLDVVLDSVGLHADEMLFIMRTLSNWKSSLLYVCFLGILFLLFGWAFVLWPIASLTGVMVCQRLRARTEHDHLNNPGKTIVTALPSLFKRLLYLPHYTWLHAEHHSSPSSRVWEK